jgi:hypothetical protein
MAYSSGWLSICIHLILPVFDSAHRYPTFFGPSHRLGSDRVSGHPLETNCCNDPPGFLPAAGGAVFSMAKGG